MAYAHTTTTTAPRSTGLVARITDALAARKVYRTTLTELQALDNRDLADLGISRSMIKSIAYEAAYGK
ncbi:Uncharacterized conserved protein YjiS, DUF1127 family [Loktanella fryxellensis]|uniref:Uncharacterized conserved protein YjiS, DUF1127 family n=1 Tax=Loktanella fryxellensis TaxID=245187 RepID=A0A1H7Z5K4_9RHOB|nr:DUF1127 domain-containing protein [Loktanella fryxellensis]SEM53892.1 Uncharacterized conserved protein YjiS, DUF1127 family [Loktanella fryxellensis]